MRNEWIIVGSAFVVMAIAGVVWFIAMLIDARRLRRRMRSIMTPKEIDEFDERLDRVSRQMIREYRKSVGIDPDKFQ